MLRKVNWWSLADIMICCMIGFGEGQCFALMLFFCFCTALCVCLVVCSTSHPGGNQVDGLPPASSWQMTDVLAKKKFESDIAQNLQVQIERA